MIIKEPGRRFEDVMYRFRIALDIGAFALILFSILTALSADIIWTSVVIMSLILYWLATFVDYFEYEPLKRYPMTTFIAFIRGNSFQVYSLLVIISSFTLYLNVESVQIFVEYSKLVGGMILFSVLYSLIASANKE